MFERHVQISTASGSMETLVVRPSGGEIFPLVIIYMDIWGVREELRDIARHVAALGYCCALPDLYYRQGCVRHEFRDPNGRMITLARLSDTEQEQVRAPLRNLSDAMVMEDTEALLRYASINAPVAVGAVAGIGYCMGGRHAVLAAGTFPHHFRAAASLHGTNLVIDGAASPHHVATKATGEIYCGFAELDRFAAPSIVQTLEHELRRAGVNYSYEMHRGADHGYALPDRDVYDEAATQRDWGAITAMLRRQLPLDGGSPCKAEN